MMTTGQHNTLSRTLAFAGRIQTLMNEKGLTSAQKTCPLCHENGALKLSLTASDQAFHMKCATDDCMDYSERTTKQ